MTVMGCKVADREPMLRGDIGYFVAPDFLSQSRHEACVELKEARKLPEGEPMDDTIWSSYFERERHSQPVASDSRK